MFGDGFPFTGGPTEGKQGTATISEPWSQDLQGAKGEVMVADVSAYSTWQLGQCEIPTLAVANSRPGCCEFHTLTLRRLHLGLDGAWGGEVG